MFNQADITAFLITLKLATVTVAILLVIGAPLAWWLARSQWRYKFLLEAFIALPLVLPPTVIGFYLLLAFSPAGAVGSVMQFLGVQPLAFTFTGLVIGSVIYSMPFVVQPLQNSFSAVSNRQLEVAATLGAGPKDRFFSIALPLARPGFITAAVLGFAHTIGEFGVVLMIGGNIPGKTQVASIAIYDHVESLEYANAHWLAGFLLFLSLVMLIVVYGLNRQTSVLRT